MAGIHPRTMGCQQSKTEASSKTHILIEPVIVLIVILLVAQKIAMNLTTKEARYHSNTIATRTWHDTGHDLNLFSRPDG